MMKQIVITLNKDEIQQLKKGGDIQFFYVGLRLTIEGPANDNAKTRKNIQVLGH